MPASHRRLTVAAVLCLLGGAAATVLVAWGFAASPAMPTLSREDYDFPAVWPRAVPADWPAPGQLSRRWSIGTSLLEVTGTEVTVTASRAMRLQLWAYGWPFRALDRELRFKSLPDRAMDASMWDQLSQSNSYRDGVPCPGSVPNPMTGWRPRLPLRPIPLGFALDTLSYATLLAMLLFAPPRLRRFLRLRRGLCPACAYNLAGNTTDICPECGTAANHRAQNEKLK